MSVSLNGFKSSALSGILATNLSGDKVLVSDSSGKIVASTVTSTQLSTAASAAGGGKYYSISNYITKNTNMQEILNNLDKDIANINQNNVNAFNYRNVMINKAFYNYVVPNIVSVVKNTQATFFLTSGGAVWACGANDGTSTNGNNGITGTQMTDGAIYIPELVKQGSGFATISNIVSVVTNDYATFFLTSTGTVWACGANNGSNGITGTRSITGVVYIPESVKQESTSITISGIVSVVTNNNYETSATFFLTTSGTVWACGANKYGPGITGTRSASGVVFIPESVKQESTSTTISSIVSVVSTLYATWFLTSTGTVWACGYNN